jgi:subtilisin family serine protease
MSLVLILVLLSAGVASARDYKLTTDGQAYYFDLSLSKVAVGFAPSMSAEARATFLSTLPAVAAAPIERVEAPLGMTIIRLKSFSDEQAVLATLASLEASPLVDWAAPVLLYDGLEHVPTPHLYVQFASGTPQPTAQSILSRYGLTLLKRCDDWAANVVYAGRAKGSGVESLDLANTLMSDPSVVWAAPDFNRIMRLNTNDPLYGNQWYLYQASRHDIHAPEAWAITTGDTFAVISICDVGVQIAHPDLAGHVNTGYDASDGDSDPTPNTTYQDDGHGTCAAGIAAAVTNNSTGIAGVGYNCRLIGTRMGYIAAGGSGIQTSDSWIINCINYSRDHAKVQSDSWGGGSPSSAVNTALQNAKNAGLTILFSSGNNNTAVSWPATQSSVIAVGATNANDYRCTPADWGSGQGSNYGASLDVVAPGNNQYATDDSRTGAGYSTGSYFASFGGTSGACPVAAGVCALIISRNHALTPDSVQSILQRTANDQVGNPTEDTPGWDQYMGWGRVNAGAAVAAASGYTITSPNGGETWFTGETHSITWTTASVTGNVKLELNRSYPAGTWETIVASISNTGSYSWPVTAPASAVARIRVSSVTTPAINDISDNNFTISAPMVTVTSPNGGESPWAGQSITLSWTSGGFTGNVNIDLNRTYPSGAWETLYSNVANDGSEPWTVTVPATTQARIRVTSVSTPSATDVSDANFTILAPIVTVLSPNGGEQLNVGVSHNITWLPTGFTSPVSIEINRAYPAGTWEMVFPSLLNDSMEAWTVSGPTTTQARIRITSLAVPTTSDVSDANFTIAGAPPRIVHDALGDIATGTGNAVVRASSTSSSIAFVSLYYRAVGTTPFTQIAVPFAAAPDYYARSLSFLLPGSYEYYVEATDNVSQVSRVPSTAPAALYTFTVGPLGGAELGYDDGSAEWFNYPGADSISFRWAVKFGPVPTPFALYGARFAASRSLPDTAHTPVHVAVYLSDGPAGMPGTLLGSYTKGSVGNIVGGLPTGTNWAQVIFRDATGNPLLIPSSEFYIAVSEIQEGYFEAFGRDTNGANAHHSYVFDPCDNQWFSEDAADTLVTHAGNRLIRAQGFGLVPPALTINRVGNDVRLFWNNMGAPAYKVYNAATPGGPFNFIQTTADTFLTVSGADSVTARTFYQVQSVTQ